MFEAADFSELPQFGAAHAQNEEWGTGCTVFVAPVGAVCGVDVRGGGPATRETDLLDPTKAIERAYAVVLSGGSAFGLEASCGVMDVLAEEGIGFRVGEIVVPIVPGACLFDLLVGANTHPDKAMGAKACVAALKAARSPKGAGRNLKMGNFGAGCGCSVGKMGLPERAMKSGFGWSGCRMGELVTIACVAVNALGNITAEDGSWLAGTLDAQGRVCNPLEAAAEVAAAAEASAAAGASRFASPAHDGAGSVDKGSGAGCVQNTTLGIVLTNATLTKTECNRVSQVTHDAYARAIKPVHTQSDGDAIFTMASCTAPVQPMQLDMIGIMSTFAMEQAIRNAVTQVKGAYGLKAVCDLST